MKEYLLGLDIGTSGSKAAIFDTEGNQYICAYAQYPLISPFKGALELDPEQVMDAVWSCLTQCAAKFEVANITALAVSTQGEAVIPVNRDGKPLMNAVLTFDARNAQQFRAFAEQTDRAEVMKCTGMPASPMFSATKIVWMRENFPEVYDSAWKLMCFGDFVSFRLGAASAMDYSMAARTMLFDLEKRDWSDSLLTLCGVSREKLPLPVPSGSEIGTAGSALVRLGFSPSLRLIAGGHDQLCCCVGAGVLEAGVVMDSMGTTESIVCVDDKLVYSPERLTCNIPVYPYPMEGLYAYMTFLSGCASLTKWFKERVVADSRETFFQEYDDYIEQHYPTPSELYVLPYFTGSGTPALDFRARGVICGLTLDTDRYQIYRGILEGLCYEESMNLANMEQSGIDVRELRCIGGGSKSALWLQIKADITGKKVLSMECEEAGCLGAALLAGYGCGLLPDLASASKRFVRVRKEFTPNPTAFERYRPHQKAYERLYRSVAPMWGDAAP